MSDRALPSGRHPRRARAAPSRRRGAAVAGGAEEAAARKRTLDRALSKAGVASRLQAAEWIAAGRVRVNGRVVRDPQRWVDPARDALEVDGRALAPLERVVLALHKPRDCVTTRSDPEGRRTVYDLLGDVGRWLVPVGRLDRDTSGLLLFTNDTDLADRLTDPARHVPKTYVVTALGRLDDGQLARLRQGVDLEDGPTRPARVLRLAPSGKRDRIEIVLTEGRNRQVRRMLEAVGSRVHALERRAIGRLELGELPRGTWRELTSQERRSLER